MPQRMGKALNKALGKDILPSAGIKKRRGLRSPLVNERRRNIYTFLCKHPGSYQGDISSGLGMDMHTLRWHLDKLRQGQYIFQVRSGGRCAFCPVGLLDPDELPILLLLNRSRTRAMFMEILRSPGSTQKELGARLNTAHQTTGKHAKELQVQGLLEVVEDGRFRRYYPTALLATLSEGRSARTRSFKERLLNKLKEEGLSPEVVRMTDLELILKLKMDREVHTLIVSTDPFSEVRI